MDESEKTINEVQRYRHLYDMQHQDYKDQINNNKKPKNLWDAIAAALGLKDGAGKSRFYIINFIC